jgi:anti-sigma factor RsiW
MNKSCRELESLLTPYVDGETTPEQCAAIEAHLSVCSACSGAAADEASARTVVHRCRERLREPAPASLHAACRKLAQKTHAANPAAASAIGASASAEAVTAGSPWLDAGRRAAGGGGVSTRHEPGESHGPAMGGWRWWAPVSAAASLLLALAGVVLFGLFSDRGTAIASQLAQDHIRCLRSIESQARPPADRVDMAERWRESRGWAVPLPASSADERVEFVALRRCIHESGDVAHAIYRIDGRLVSLYIFEDAAQRRANLEIMGQHATIWSQHGHSYAVVTSGSPQDVGRLVEFFKRGLE